MTELTRRVRDVPVPTFIYGTAWKEERTAELVTEALAHGFRGVDTANQRKHYHEAGVGRALARAFEGGGPERDELFVQTKFTYPAGQDHRLPYDPDADVAVQVEQSCRSSLEHLGLETLDGYLLHGPSQRRGLGDADREAWSAMEDLHADGLVRLIGVSNVTADQLQTLCETARVKPALVQNRCFARTGWDAAVREVCSAEGVLYQGFSLLTANRRALAEPRIEAIAEDRGRTVPQIVFRFALELDIVPLTGTTDPAHMAEDLEVYDFELSDEEVRAIEGVGR